MRKWFGGVGGSGDGRERFGKWIRWYVQAQEAREREGHEEVTETKARNVPIGP